MSHPAKIIVLEGNIGVGKTTLVEQIATALNFRPFYEPTNTNPYLADFYRDPRRHAMNMQLWIYRQRFNMYITALKHIDETGQGVVLDRSMFGDGIFAKTNADCGNISPHDYDRYTAIREDTMRKLPIPDVFVFLNASVETCMRRIEERNRGCEAAIDPDYLTALDWEFTKLARELSTESDVVHIDWENFHPVEEVVNRIQSSSPSRRHPVTTGCDYDAYNRMIDEAYVRHDVRIHPASWDNKKERTAHGTPTEQAVLSTEK